MGGYRSILAIAILIALAGCSKMLVTSYDTEGKITSTVEASQGGRGCMAASKNSEGFKMVVQQDGSSDWGIFRTLSRFGDAVVAFFTRTPGAKSDPDGPSDIAGCAGIFGTKGSAVLKTYELRPVQ